MQTGKKVYHTLVSQTKQHVPGFESAYAQFHQRVQLDQNSKSMITN
jgi:hypothetical protein